MRVHSGIAPPRPAPPQPTVPAPRGLRSNETGSWFEAPCAFGSVRLCVEPGGEAARHAADAALALRRCEPLLAALDDWIGVDLAWRWVAAPPPGAAGGVATARRRGDAQEPECVVSWPWAMLRALPAPPPAARLEWPVVAAVLVLARLQLGLDELGLLEPGGAVLVPQSMLPPWHGTLRSADEAVGGVAVDLSTPWRPRLAGKDASAAACATPADPQRTACELRLDLALGVSAQRLAGWCDGDAGDIVHLAESGLRAALWRSASPRQAEQGLAGGRMMPWGDGWAFALESLETSPQ